MCLKSISNYFCAQMLFFLCYFMLSPTLLMMTSQNRGITTNIQNIPEFWLYSNQCIDVDIGAAVIINSTTN